jgi:hypothetical protein
MAHPALSRLLASDAFWRYVDAFAPRLFAIALHTALVWKFGPAAYALPAWLLGAFGLLLAMVPDPHGFILMRGHGARARRLLGLAVPSVLLKLVLVAIAAFLAVDTFAAPTLVPGKEPPHAMMAAVCTYAAAEALWSVLGTTALAVGNVRKLAVTGLVARLISTAAIAVSWLMIDLGMAASFMLAAIPIAAAAVMFIPLAGSLRRCAHLYRFSTLHYAIWSQAIALMTGLLAQAPILALGAWPLLSPSGVGQVAFFVRVVMAAVQPLQVLQSLVVRETSRAKGTITPMLGRMRRAFRVGAVAIGLTCSVALAVLRARHAISDDVWLLCGAVSLGVAFSAWHRFELSRLLAGYRLRDLCLRGYLPICGSAAMAIAMILPGGGVAALAMLLLFAWIGVSVCWVWLRPASE